MPPEYHTWENGSTSKIKNFASINIDHREFFLNLKETFKFKKSLLELGRWFSWCRACLASKHEDLSSIPRTHIKKKKKKKLGCGSDSLVLIVPELGRWR